MPHPEDPSLWFTAPMVHGPAVVTFLTEGVWYLKDDSDETLLQFSRGGVSFTALYVPENCKLKHESRGFVSGYRV